MGTRHLIAVVSNGEYKVAQYGQWDGYLDGQGATIVKFIQNELDPVKFKQAVDNCSFLSGAELDKIYDKGNEIPKELSRDTGAGILSLIQRNNGAKLANSLSFAGDSLFCEYAYVLDLDTETLEIYQGFNKQPLEQGERFAEFSGTTVPVEFYPVKLLMAFSFDDATEENIKALNDSLNAAQDEQTA